MSGHRGLPGRQRNERGVRPGLAPGRRQHTAPAALPALAGDRGAVRSPVGDRGAVTAEVAIGLVAVTVVLLAVLATGAATVARVACLDAARTGARVAALGTDDAEVVAAVRHVLDGRRADVAVTRDDGWVTVSVTAPLAATTDGLTARASATAWVEP